MLLSCARLIQSTSAVLAFCGSSSFVDVLEIQMKAVGLFNTWVELEKQECTVYLRLSPLMRHLVENVPRSC